MVENKAKEMADGRTKLLFWGCWIALVATSVGFIVRAGIIGDWGAQFNLTETQKGELLGVGLWPFALSIVLFSLVVDKIGYGTAMIFAFTCHILSAIVTILATGYAMLYIGTFIMALGNGTVEAVINPIVATIFPKEKTKWLNILHAGWPGGLVLGGLIFLIMGEAHWTWKVAIIILPAVIYGLILIRCTFPVQERVQAGVSYKAMLQEAGIIGAIIVVAIIVAELIRILGAGDVTSPAGLIILIIGLVVVVVYSVYVKSLGRPMFLFLLLIMLPLATTELGTDSWITDLVTPIMQGIGLPAIIVLIYTSFIMMVLRFYAGPIVERLSPLGLLAVCSAIACLGLIWLSKAAGFIIFLAATFYALGKTFFWPTMLGVVAERFPKGGALTINAIGGMGMLSVGVIGAAFLGNIQDKQIDRELLEQDSAIHAQVAGEEKISVFGAYRSIDHNKVLQLPAEEQSVVNKVTAAAKQNALATVAIFPFIMLICYLILIFYFRSKGGYKAEELVVQKE
jgi:MFS family permease